MIGPSLRRALWSQRPRVTACNSDTRFSEFGRHRKSQIPPSLELAAHQHHAIRSALSHLESNYNGRMTCSRASRWLEIAPRIETTRSAADVIVFPVWAEFQIS